MNKNEDTNIDPELTPLDKKQVRKKLLILGLAVLMILGGLVFATAKLYTPPVVVEGCEPGDIFSRTNGKPCKEVEVVSCAEGELYNRNTGEPCVGVEYTDAVPGENFGALLKSYTGKSFLLDANCFSNPKLLNVPLGTKILTVNNSKRALEINILDEVIILKPYQSAVSTFSKAGLFPLSCNGSMTGTVIVK